MAISPTTGISGGVNTDLSNDTTPELGGFLDANGNYIQMQRGADIASASPLVVDTDGDQFDVTGTTSFSVMTVAADRRFVLHFDGILTMTHGASLDLPGAANITTAAGDIGTFITTAANTVRCVGYMRNDGTPVAVNIVADTTPQLGGNLDALGLDINNLGALDFDTTDKGSVGSGTVTFSASVDGKQKLTVTGTLTLAFDSWAATGHYSEVEIELVNGGSATVTHATVNWAVGDGTTSTTFADTGITLATSGTNHLIVWTTDGGSTLYGVAA
jgi:hypothetical protein